MKCIRHVFTQLPYVASANRFLANCVIPDKTRNVPVSLPTPPVSLKASCLSQRPLSPNAHCSFQRLMSLNAHCLSQRPLPVPTPTACSNAHCLFQHPLAFTTTAVSLNAHCLFHAYCLSTPIVSERSMSLAMPTVSPTTHYLPQARSLTQ